MVNMCRVCLGSVVGVSSDDMKNDGTLGKFLVIQDQTDSGKIKKTLFQDYIQVFYCKHALQ